MTESNDDGVALQSTAHPIEITEAMVNAGLNVAWDSGDLQGNAQAEKLVRSIFMAMASAALPLPEDLNEASLESALVKVMVHELDIERVARAIARGHGAKMTYQPAGDLMHTVASQAGFGRFGDAADRYAESRWQDYKPAAELAIAVLTGGDDGTERTDPAT